MSEKVKISNARLAFPSLFNTDSYDRYSAVLILEPNNPAIAAINAAIDKVVKAELKGKKPGSASLCLRKSEEKANNYEGFTATNYHVSASRKEPFKPNQVIDRDKSEITNPKALYAGCYVNALINVWAQDNSYGKRVNAELVGIQFVKDGEKFGRGSTDVADDDFDSLPPLDGESPDDLF